MGFKGLWLQGERFPGIGFMVRGLRGLTGSSRRDFRSQGARVEGVGADFLRWKRSGLGFAGILGVLHRTR